MEGCNGHGMTRMAVKEILTEEDKNALKSIGFSIVLEGLDIWTKDYTQYLGLVLQSSRAGGDVAINYTNEDIYETFVYKVVEDFCDMTEIYCDITRLIMLGIVKIEK